MNNYEYILDNLWRLTTPQRQALQARRASRCHKPFHYTALLRRRSEGSEAGGVIFRRQLSRRLQAHVGCRPNRSILLFVNKLNNYYSFQQNHYSTILLQFHLV
jgi:hypothetical protein